VYSPVGRDIQTSFSLLTGQYLAKKKRVLYLNLEPFSGLSEMLDNRVDRDITDLIYYLVSGKEKLRYKLESMVNNIGGLDYVSPAFSFLDLGQVSAENWLLLINTLRECGNYDYLIIDLSEIIQGLFDILKECDVVYTIAQKEGLGPAKLDQYEKLLKTEDLDSVIERTSRCELPLFNDLPSGFDELPYSKLASYVKQIVNEDL
jgi:cellulose biosynthesis protein BcsQ